MQYAIITGSNAEEFAKLVNSYLRSGWKLQGGVCICMDVKDHPCHGQAMTKDLDPVIRESRGPLDLSSQSRLMSGAEIRHHEMQGSLKLGGIDEG